MFKRAVRQIGERPDTPLSVMLANGSLYGGGAEHVIGTLARQLRAAGHKVTVAVMTSGGEVQEELRGEGFEVIDGIAPAGVRGAPWTLRRLCAIVGERGVDIVHTHDLRSLMDVAMCRLARGRFRHVHTFHFGNYPHVSRSYLIAEGVCARLPDHLVAVGDVQRASIVEALKLKPDRVTTVWNGVDLPAETNGNGTAAAARGPVPLIGSVSTLGTQKGIPTLLEAVSLLHQRGLAFRLLIVGEGALRPELEARTRALGLDDVVRFAGWVPDASLSLLPTFDVFVQSSYWEAMSVVILEAMAARRPIVATSVGENSFVLKHGVTALLVPPKAPEALADALALAITDPSLRARLAQSARETYERAFTGQKMAERYMAIYRGERAC
jgi:glycosyltransferase involved in cell wall biosynthesis